MMEQLMEDDQKAAETPSSKRAKQHHVSLDSDDNQSK